MSEQHPILRSLPDIIQSALEREHSHGVIVYNECMIRADGWLVWFTVTPHDTMGGLCGADRRMAWFDVKKNKRFDFIIG